MTPEQRIERAFHHAREQRLKGASPIAPLEEAASIATVHLAGSMLAARSVWKLAKARADHSGTLDVEALNAAHDHGIPIYALPFHRRAARALRWHQDRAGYEARALVDAWEHLRREAAEADAISLDTAWCHLCRGDLETMHDVLDGVDDTEGVLYTTLCAANWSRQPEHVDADALRDRFEHPLPDHFALAAHEYELRYRGDLPIPEMSHPYATAMGTRSGFDAAMACVSGPEFRLGVWQSAAIAGEPLERPPLLGCAIFTTDATP